LTQSAADDSLVELAVNDIDSLVDFVVLHAYLV
jgi:hypothetical protein